MPRVVILTPSPGHDDHPALWRKVLGRLQAALANVGAEVACWPWTDDTPARWQAEDPDCVLPLLAWGYHKEHPRWREACTEWERRGVPIANPAKVLAWNSDKRYLQSLSKQGVPIPPTVFAETLSQDVVDAAFEQMAADELIIKPAVSGGAWNTRRIRRGEPIGASTHAVMLLQPYLPTIETEGETSLLYFGGVLSHAVNKRPVANEFRIQEEFGGIYTLLEVPPAGTVALAGQVLAAVGEPLLYARIDMVPDADGRWLLMEAELIEPDFYLGMDPAGGARFATALGDWIRERRTA